MDSLRSNGQSHRDHLSRLAALEELAATAVHELKQPLCAIRTLAEACRRRLENAGVRDQKLADNLEMIVGQVEQADRMLQSVRALSRRQDPVRQKMDLNHLIREEMAYLAGDFEALGVRVELELTEPLPSVTGDPDQIRRVLFNLARNAIEAMEQAPIRTLRIATRRSSDGGAHVELQDTASGIDPEARERIFQPFYTTKPQGLGIGLAICRSTIETHGGRIWTHRNTDRGSTFAFVLPAHEGGATDVH